jgi:hypothetical protein
MNTDELIDNTITSLKIISMVQKNGRLCIRKGQLAIETNDKWQSVRRWLSNDSRDQTLMHMRNCINNAVKLSKAIINNSLDVDMRTWTISRLIIEMNNCQAGLVNLKTTYTGDAPYVAAIDVLLERLIANCYELQIFIESQPSPKTANTRNNNESKNNTK